MALYSALKEELDELYYFLHFQPMGEFPKRITYPMTDLVDVGQDA